MNCPNCGGTVPAGTKRCLKCGSYVESQAAPVGGQVVGQPGTGAQVGGPLKSKTVAGLLGILLGGLGAHRFYLGYTGIGLLQLALSLVTCGVAGIWGFVEGIMILTGSFSRDAFGRQLR